MATPHLMTQTLASSAPNAVFPRQPETLEETGLPESTVEQLILKILYYRGELYGKALAAAIGLKYSVIQPFLEALILHRHIESKRSLGIGHAGSVFALTQGGRGRARECMDENQYGGAAPVPHKQYIEMVRRQKPHEGWLTEPAIRKALKGMVVTNKTIFQLGPAINTGNSLLVYGKPGDGKTFLIESLNNIDAAPVFVPHAIECQGNIIRVFDPVYHERLDQPGPDPVVSDLYVSTEAPYDQRWVKCRRPFVVSGGELSLEMLDLRYNRNSKIYEAPFQMKANNGMYLVDDFGRQVARPAEILNRWIVPLERRIDYLTFLTGGTMTTPFETFLVLSSNLNPGDLGDEAFLRRIQYKMLLEGPTEEEFLTIFERTCAARALSCAREVMERFVAKHYRATTRTFRRCHPRDVLTHALGLIHFKKLPMTLNDEILDHAFDSCFVQTAQPK